MLRVLAIGGRPRRILRLSPEPTEVIPFLRSPSSHVKLAPRHGRSALSCGRAVAAQRNGEECQDRTLLLRALLPERQCLQDEKSLMPSYPYRQSRRPLMLPPGRDRLETQPVPTGLLTTTKIIGSCGSLARTAPIPVVPLTTRRLA